MDSSPVIEMTGRRQVQVTQEVAGLGRRKQAARVLVSVPESAPRQVE